MTYDNVCVLRAQSSNARVDYSGGCVESSGANREEICGRVDRLGRCRFNTSNCRSLVSPEEGCCPLCGE